LQQFETRGVDEEELRRMKRRQADRERIEQQQGKLPKQNDNGDGLRVSLDIIYSIEYYFILVANELILVLEIVVDSILYRKLMKNDRYELYNQVFLLINKWLFT
jgi:hypothetical protein